VHLGANHDDVVDGPGLHHRCRGGEPVQKSGALVSHIQATDEVAHIVVRQAELGLKVDPRTWETVLWREGRKDDHADVGLRELRTLQSHLDGWHGQIGSPHAVRRKAPRFDACALFDPLVGGVDPVARR
jgi:hypothetical protein